MIDYLCVVHKNHTSSFDAPQAVPPECCGKPMVLAQPAGSKAPAGPAAQTPPPSAQQPAVPAQPAAAPAATQPLATPVKSPAPQQARKSMRGRRR